MCKLMDDLINDVVKDRDIETAKKLIALGKLPLEDIAEAYDLPLSTVEELASQIKKNKKKKKDPA